MKLVCVAAAHANVPNVPSLDNIVECLHRLLDGSAIVKPVTLKHVDIVELKTPEAVLDTGKDVLAAETRLIDGVWRRNRSCTRALSSAVRREEDLG
jgi:hypothetical protein